MSMQDPISDMLTRMRNASQVGKHDVTMPYSKLKAAIAQVLVDEGYVTKFDKIDGAKPELVIELKYHQGKPVIESSKRVSRPGFANL